MVLIVQFVQGGLSYVNMPESIKCKTFVQIIEILVDRKLWKSLG